jgi:hypothetical protein
MYTANTTTNNNNSTATNNSTKKYKINSSTILNSSINITNTNTKTT